MTKKRTLSRAAAWTIAIIAAVVVGLGLRFAIETGRAPQIPNIAIGGPFTLVDQNGRTRTAADFRGKFMLVYFGYTFCPDVCPGELATMTAAIDALGKKGDQVVPIFITIDPERDTVARLKSYIANFHPRFVALTGTAAAVSDAANVYRVHFVKKPDGKTYSMDHTTVIYLMGPDGRFLRHFSFGTTAEKMTAGIADYL